MDEYKNIVSIKENKNILKKKYINNKTYISAEEESNLKLEQSTNNDNYFLKKIILALKKRNLNYKGLSIFLKSLIMILLIVEVIILHSNIYNLFHNNKNNILIIDENTNNIKNNILKENISNSSIFDIVYNDIIFNNYISGDFFSNISNNKTIFYVKTDYLNKQAWRVTKNYTVLITHNSDINIDSSKYSKFLECGKFKYWFAQNPIKNESRLFTLPLGLMNKRWHNYSRFKLMMEEKKKNIKPSKLLLLSFSIKNNKIKRQQCLDSLINKTYITNNVANKVKNFGGKEYDRKFFKIMLDHLFVACPEGRGIDSHRFWETLYMGRYPVVLHNNVNDAFSDLPVLILNKWEDFEKEHLMFLQRIKSKKFSYEKLTQEYWINRINNLK